MVSYATVNITACCQSGAKSSSAVCLHQKQNRGREINQDDVDEDLKCKWQNVCTVVGMQIIFCLIECTSFLRNMG